MIDVRGGYGPGCSLRARDTLTGSHDDTLSRPHGHDHNDESQQRQTTFTAAITSASQLTAAKRQLTPFLDHVSTRRLVYWYMYTLSCICIGYLPSWQGQSEAVQCDHHCPRGGRRSPTFCWRQPHLLKLQTAIVDDCLHPPYHRRRASGHHPGPIYQVQRPMLHWGEQSRDMCFALHSKRSTHLGYTSRYVST